MSLGKAQYYIDKLGLTRHLEGGAFKETYRSELIIPKHVYLILFKATETLQLPSIFYWSMVNSVPFIK
jgi:predicted cupin superfamily sugar epimerase